MREVWAWCVRYLPEDRTNRYLVVTFLISVILHILVGAALIFSGSWKQPIIAKKGEPLFVDIAPSREPAPLGNPSKPLGPDSPEPAKPAAPPAPKVAPTPPAPRAVETPKPAPPKPAPREVAKAAPQAPPKSEEPAPAAKPQPQPAEAPKPAQQAPQMAPPQPSQPAQQPSPGSEQRVASAPQPPSPPAGMFRKPGGGGGLKGGRGGIEGDPIPLDTPDPKYQDYFNKIREKIQRNWTYPSEAGDRGIEGELLIEFGIAKSGELQFIEKRRTSGVAVLDEYAMRAVQLASPFPPVPDGISKSGLAINGIFRYQIVGASMLNKYLR